MAHVIVMLSPKGGVGKSTLAIVLAGELAKRGLRVGLVDADPNQPLAGWKAMGHAPDGITVYVDHDERGGTIRETVRQASAENDWVIIDTEGTENARVTRAVPAAHMALIPVTNSFVDVREAAKAIKLVREVSEGRATPVHYSLVQTRTDAAISSREDNAIREMIDKAELPVLDVGLVNRAAFRAMHRLGDTIHGMDDKETPGLPKARENATALLAAVLNFYTKAGEGQAAKAA